MGQDFSALSKLYDIDKGPELNSGMAWNLRNASKNNQKLTLFYTKKQSNDPVIILLKKEVQMLLKLRHPNVLHVQQPPTNIVGFSSEPIKLPLFMAQLSEVEKLNGMKQLSTAIQFLHENAKIIHNCINPYNIYITNDMQWKLAGFYFAQYFNYYFAQYFNYNSETMTSNEYNLNDNMYIEYCSPEFIINHQINIQNDDYSFGMMLAFVYGKPPPAANSNLLSFKHFQERLSDFVGTLPLNIQSLVQQLTTASMVRISHKDCLKDVLFTDNVYLKCLDTFDSINTIAVVEKAKFFKALQQPGIFKAFPSEMVTNKFIPILLQQIKEIQLVTFIIPVLFYLLQEYGTTNDTELIFPQLKPICTPQYPAAARLLLFQQYHIFKTKSRSQYYKNEILGLLIVALELQEPETNAAILEILSDIDVLKLIDYTVLKRMIIKKTDYFLQGKSRIGMMHFIKTVIVHQVVDVQMLPEIIQILCGINDLSICELFGELTDSLDEQYYVSLILPNMLKTLHSLENRKNCEVVDEVFLKCYSKIKEKRFKKLSSLSNNTPHTVTISSTNPNNNYLTNPNLKTKNPSPEQWSEMQPAPKDFVGFNNTKGVDFVNIPTGNHTFANQPSTVAINKQPSLGQTNRIGMNQIMTNSQIVKESPVPNNIPQQTKISDPDQFNPWSAPPKKDDFGTFTDAPTMENPFQNEQSFPNSFQFSLKNKLDKKSNNSNSNFDPYA
eukprot:NODE_123_length_17687_cov_0.732261.p1 type:complete len:723 gc:universal NODE_123_length_17687_cov_0.732261:8311-10479(+)